MLANSLIVVRNNSERSCVLFTQFLLVVMSCKPIVQYHNQDTDNDTVKIQYISITGGSLMMPVTTFDEVTIFFFLILAFPMAL